MKYIFTFLIFIGLSASAFGGPKWTISVVSLMHHAFNLNKDDPLEIVKEIRVRGVGGKYDTLEECEEVLFRRREIAKRDGYTITEGVSGRLTLLAEDFLNSYSKKYCHIAKFD